MYPYRVFICYFHEENQTARTVRKHLEDIGASPMSDDDLPPGQPYHEEIQRRIACAHVVVPILTQASADRTWVLHEIGYAMGMRVPVLPLVLDESVAGMVEGIQALKILTDLSDLDEHLTSKRLEALVQNARQKNCATFHCAPGLYERTETIVEHAAFAQDISGLERVRQRMAFGSFSLPDKRVKHADWDIRNPNASAALRELLREERRALEMHTREGGCDLIIDPYVPIGRGDDGIQFKHSSSGTEVRVRTLLDFFQSMPNDKLRVIIRKGYVEGSILIVGDLFCAEAVVPHHSGGYRQTVFTWHAPTVLKRIEEFDQEFKDLLAEVDLKGRSSREAAIETLTEILTECRKEAGHPA